MKTRFGHTIAPAGRPGGRADPITPDKPEGGQPVKLQVFNEYDPLEVVLVHRPGEEIDRLTHENMKAFLFEDIPYLARMQDEHDEFVDEMRDRGVRVLHLDKLLRDLLDGQPETRRKLIDQVCAAEQATGIAAELHDPQICPNDVLVGIVFKGLTHAEYAELTRRPLSSGPVGKQFILRPIPNAYFSRDPAVVIGQSVISCKMHFVERIRETVLARAVLEHHPEFKGHRIAYGGSDAPRDDRPFTVEGGDVIVLNAEAVLVGVSERTRLETIEILARRIFESGRHSRLYGIPIPTERTFMHLDTVFTIVDRGMVVWYPGVMEQVKFIHRYDSDGAGNIHRADESRGLTEILSDEFGKEVTIIRTGGGDEHYASREQRTDGTNILALAPRVACTYERNARTIVAMEKAGVEVVKIVGSELVRGLGGPRCMTMPLRRSSQASG